ncbi:MAG: methyl-accepting chemotaxis protein [candidate division KSB1 bacterium]|nr:methyl-accepting chemotaxis protein [candidate division KSB1 bacterium]
MGSSRTVLSLRTKLLLLVESVVIVLAVGVSLYFARLQRSRTLEEIDRLVEALASNLAFQGRFGLLLGDTEELNRALQSVQVEDVVYGAYLDSAGNVAASVGNVPSRKWVAPEEKLVWDARAVGGEKVREAVAPVRVQVMGATKKVGAAVLAVSLRHLQEVQARAMKVSLLVILVFSLLGYLATSFLTWHIVTPLRELQEASSRIASGDRQVTIAVQRADEIGRLADAFRRMADDINRAFAELESQRREAEKLREVAEEARRTVEAHNQKLQAELHALLETVEQMSSGDLSIRIDLDTDGELGQLAEKIQIMAGTLHDILAEIRSVSETLVGAANKIRTSTENMASSASEQTAQVTDVVSSMAEISGTIRETAEYIQKVAHESQNAKEIARKGYQHVEEIYRGLEEIVSSQEAVTATISNLVSQVATIGEIASVIEEIADQTNLLALNAAIEAARAGEHGRGFAVVAEEVGKLAERTTTATRQIAQVIKAIQQRTAETDQSVAAARSVAARVTEAASVMQRAMQEIVSGAEVVQEMLSHVATSSQQQSAAAEQVSRGMEAIRTAAMETATSTHEIAVEAEGLSHLAARLDGLLSQFRLEETPTRVTEVSAPRWGVRQKAREYSVT